MGYYNEDGGFGTDSSISDRMGRGSTLKKFMSSGEITITNGLDRIRESIVDILSTRVGTRFFLPEYGSLIEELLFEPSDMLVIDAAKEYSMMALERWEPRIDVSSVDAEIEGLVLKIRINYIVKDTGTPDSYVYVVERRAPELM